MARMSIDDMVVRDPRITKLASLVGWSRRETVGCLVLDVWPICYDQREHTIAAELIDIAAQHVGFAAAMANANLAQWVRGNSKVRIKGAQERIEYLDHKREAGRVGGLKSAESRRQKSSTTSSDAQARGNPSVPDPPSASAPPSVPVPDPPPASKSCAASPRTPRPVREPTDHQRAIDHFDRRYKADNAGRSPDWPTSAKLIADLTKRYGADEVIRRTDLLFDGKGPHWLTAPFTVKTLKAQWEALAIPSAPKAQTQFGGLRNADLIGRQLERVREAEQERLEQIAIVGDAT